MRRITLTRWLPALCFYFCIFSLLLHAGSKPELSVRELLDTVQQDCFRYFWDAGDPRTGMAYEASFSYSTEGRPLAVGGTGFGIAALPAAVERGWITRDEAVGRLSTIVSFLRDETQRLELHGAFPHWLHNETGKIIRFSEADDGADLVETALLMQGLLIARAYFDRPGIEADVRDSITTIWQDIDWQWFSNAMEDGLYWHWSPNHGFTLGLKIQGFNECLIAYILALGSPTHPITRKTFDHWTAGTGYETRNVFGYEIEGTTPGGGPLFLTHYSFIGLNPWIMADRFVPGGYYVRNVRQALSNRGYCVYEAPAENQYDDNFWGLTASLIPDGYAANEPLHDTGIVAPTAALASMPYVPVYAVQVARSLRALDQVWGEYGPYDAINKRVGWIANEYLAIDQLPITCMIENYCSGLLWNLFMQIPEVQAGLAKAGIGLPTLPEGFPETIATKIRQGAAWVDDAYTILQHPDTYTYHIPFWVAEQGKVMFTLLEENGSAAFLWEVQAQPGRNELRLPLAVESNNRRRVQFRTEKGKVYSLMVELY